MSLLRSLAASIGIPLLPIGTKADTKIYRFVPNAKALLRTWLECEGYIVKTFGTPMADCLKPDFAKEGYHTGTLWIYDPTGGNGALTWDADYTWVWRASHEYGHAVSLATIDKEYGKGRRNGKLGAPLTLRECKRAVAWEHMAFRAQWNALENWNLLDNPFPGHYYRENAVNSLDAVIRCLTGDFTDPATEGVDIKQWQFPATPSVVSRMVMAALDVAAYTMEITE